MTRLSISAKARFKRPLIQALGIIHGDQCYYCRIPVWMDVAGPDDPHWQRSATIDHVVPLAEGGTNDLDNLVLACKWCNNHKGSTPEDHFRKWLTEVKWGEDVR